MTTHAQKADAYLEMALSEKFEKSPAGDRAATLAISMAQAHATLALVEQQRATNLILATALNFGWGKADITVPWNSVNDTPRWEAMRAEIAEALGIEQES